MGNFPPRLSRNGSLPGTSPLAKDAIPARAKTQSEDTRLGGVAYLRKRLPVDASAGHERKPQAQPERSSGKDRGVPVLPTATGTSFLPPYRRGILSRLWAYFIIYKNKNQGVCPFLSGIFRLPVKGRKTHGRGRLSIPQGKCTGQRLCRVSHTRLPTKGCRQSGKTVLCRKAESTLKKRENGQKTNHVPKTGGNKPKSDKKRHSVSGHRKQPIKQK